MSIDKLKNAANKLADKAMERVADGLNTVSELIEGDKPQGKQMLKDIVVADKPVPAVKEGAIVVLEKGANIAIEAAIETIGCGIEWDEVTTGSDFDADVSCLLVDTDGANELVYYGMLQVGGKLITKCGSVYHTGDNLTGADDAVEGVAVNEDDETIYAQLSNLPTSVDKVIFFVNIYQASQKGQNFGTTGTMKARLYDVDTGEVFMEADLMEDNATQTSMIVGEFYRKENGWKYKNMAQGGKQTVQEFVNSNN